MAIAALKIKVMPEQGINLEELSQAIENELKKVGAIKINSIQEEEIAFGLKALIVTIAWPETQDTEKVENLKVQGISSIQIIDYRRAFG